MEKLILILVLLQLQPLSAFQFQPTGPVLWRTGDPIVSRTIVENIDLAFLSPCDLLEKTNDKEACGLLFSDLKGQFLRMCQHREQYESVQFPEERRTYDKFLTFNSTVIALLGTSAAQKYLPEAETQDVETLIQDGSELEGLVHHAKYMIPEIYGPFLKDEGYELDNVLGFHSVKVIDLKLLSHIFGKGKEALEKVMETGIVGKEFYESFGFRMEWLRLELYRDTAAILNSCMPDPESGYPYTVQSFKLSFIYFIVDPSVTLVEAEPFQTYVSDGKEICKLSYKGPNTALIFDDGEAKPCVSFLGNKEELATFYYGFANTCRNPHEFQEIESSPFRLVPKRYFEVSGCQLKQNFSYGETIQVKQYSSGLVVYCFGHKLEVNGDVSNCPNYPFKLNSELVKFAKLKCHKGTEACHSLETYAMKEQRNVTLEYFQVVDEVANITESQRNVIREFRNNRLTDKKESFRDYLQGFVGTAFAILLVTIFCRYR